jgi:hypothetical protein
VTFNASAVLLALNVGTDAQRVERACEIGNLVERFEVAVVSDLDNFLGLVDTLAAPPRLPLLEPAVA